MWPQYTQPSKGTPNRRSYLADLRTKPGQRSRGAQGRALSAIERVKSVQIRIVVLAPPVILTRSLPAGPVMQRR